MRKQWVFPTIRQLVTASAAPSVHQKGRNNLISKLRAEHDRIGELFSALRRLTHAYEAPTDGCASYRSCYAGLAALEADTHLHVHKENNLLFPAVVRLLEGAAGERS